MQTVAHLFYDRDRTPDASFEVKTEKEVDNVRAMISNDYECLVVLWTGDGAPAVTTDIHVDSDEFAYPVRVPLLNYRAVTDLPYDIDSDGSLVIRGVTIKANEPVIIRLVKEEQAWAE